MQSFLSLSIQVCLYPRAYFKCFHKINLILDLVCHCFITSNHDPLVSSATYLPHLFLSVVTTTPLATTANWCSSTPPSRTWHFPASDCPSPLGLQPYEAGCCLSTTDSFIHSTNVWTYCVPTIV